ncbi:ImmA/IrrE family metallo-endopeptidase [Rhizobium sp. TRM96647]|uniref:ImmA/IrrE family metallo-endopeptidase n=1 Tax=unclassified Rhizobium TaxID=2613769 RepID=UPI0021E89965|nr:MULTISPECIES: ImmA/IrrE family metallo-endopeptidase [unclassified Rhizobium]MCV3737714.1 ImmA/IrrE family metallo-endopeptidase [Rhizobium sp. TRM96647]MCV3759556.1 ImmA/IrrE family metallo-endopeptidase [Rhizobium sp. TRM96650]
MKRNSAEWIGLPEGTKRAIQSYQKDIPVRIGDLAKSFGIDVKLSTLDVGISGMIHPDNGRYKIVINKHEPEYRRRFTLAHELSHFILHRDLIGLGIKDNVLYRSQLSDALEAEANRLASDILMPIDKVKEVKGELLVSKLADAVSLLAHRFKVSEEAMRIRLGMK